MKNLESDVRNVLTAYESSEAKQLGLRTLGLDLLAQHPDAVWNRERHRHITASVLIVDESRETVLLTLHPKAKLWLQVGGHCERTDDRLIDTALREATEESGIHRLKIDPDPLELDLHSVACFNGIRREHVDVRYLAVAPEGALHTCSAESLDLRWFPYDALPDQTASDTPGLVAKAFDRLALRTPSSYLSTSPR